MNNLAKSVLDNDEVTAIIHAKHQDVFSVLGMHTDPVSNAITVRTFLPEAQSVEVIDSKNNKSVAILNLVEASGLFEGK